MLFAVAGTIISTLVFAMSTYLLMAIGLVKRSNLGDNALVVCLLYGGSRAVLPCQFSREDGEENSIRHGAPLERTLGQGNSAIQNWLSSLPARPEDVGQNGRPYCIRKL